MSWFWKFLGCVMLDLIAQINHVVYQQVLSVKRPAASKVELFVRALVYDTYMLSRLRGPYYNIF